MRAQAELELRKKKSKTRTKEDSPFTTFQKTYSHNLVGFVHDCINFRGDEPTHYQDEILEIIPVEHKVSVRGPHGCGKTALSSWLILWGVLTSDDCKVPTTASVWRQLTKYLWPEVHKWAFRLKWNKICRPKFTRQELLTLSLKRSDTCEAFAVASDQPDYIEGAHGERVVYVFDEAKAIPDATFNAAEGAFSGAGEDTGREAYALAISTPGEPVGRFYDIHARSPGYEDWKAIHVTLEDAIKAGRISRNWAEQRKRQWGEKSAVYQNRVLGEFASSEDDNVIPLAWVEAANNRWLQWADDGKPGAFTSVGVDVGRGGDKSVFALRFGNAIDKLRRNDERDTMVVAGYTTAILSKYKGCAIIDVVGVGAGVVDRVRELGHEVVAFSAGSKTDKKDLSGEMGFDNKRSAAWWNLREMLDPNNDIGVAIPPDDMLTGDLTAPHWKVLSGGKYSVESKDDIRKRIGRSTDDGDAVVQAFWDGDEKEENYGGKATSVARESHAKAVEENNEEYLKLKYLGKRAFILQTKIGPWSISEGWERDVEKELAQEIAHKYKQFFRVENE